MSGMNRNLSTPPKPTHCYSYTWIKPECPQKPLNISSQIKKGRLGHTCGHESLWSWSELTTYHMNEFTFVPIHGSSYVINSLPIRILQWTQPSQYSTANPNDKGLTSSSMPSEAIELIGPAHRLTSLLMYQMAFPVGECFLALAAYHLRHWDILQMALAVPVILLLPYYWWVGWTISTLIKPSIFCWYTSFQAHIHIVTKHVTSYVSFIFCHPRHVICPGVGDLTEQINEQTTGEKASPIVSFVNRFKLVREIVDRIWPICVSQR